MEKCQFALWVEVLLVIVLLVPMVVLVVVVTEKVMVAPGHQDQLDPVAAMKYHHHLG